MVSIRLSGFHLIFKGDSWLPPCFLAKARRGGRSSKPQGRVPLAMPVGIYAGHVYLRLRIVFGFAVLGFLPLNTLHFAVLDRYKGIRSGWVVAKQQ